MEGQRLSPNRALRVGECRQHVLLVELSRRPAIECHKSDSRAHPKLWVRITLVIIAVIFAGAIDPVGRVFKDKILSAYDKAHVDEPMDDVLDRFQYDSGIVIVPNKDKKRRDELDCIGESWLRLIYEVPVIIGERWVTLEFGHDQKLIRKCNMDGKCLLRES